MNNFIKFISLSALSLSALMFPKANACNVVDFLKSSFVFETSIIRSNGRILDGVIPNIELEMPDIENTSKINISLLSEEIDFNIYKMIITFDSNSHKSLRYTLYTDNDLDNNLKYHYEMTLEKDSKIFSLLKGLIQSQKQYDFIEKEELNALYVDRENLGSLSKHKEHLYKVISLYINMLLNNLSKIS